VRASLVRFNVRRTMEATSLMGEITFIKDGYASVIHDDGTITTTALDRCDECLEWQTTAGGLTIRDHGQEVVIWVCAKCRR
jgi:hypothetical protein